LKKFYFLFSFSLVFILLSFKPTQNCSKLKNNSFTYTLAGKKVLVKFTENEQIEYHQNGKYFIKSAVIWGANCEYFLTVKETTLPNYPFKMGTKLHVVITKIKGDKIYYKASFENRTWEGKFRKVKD